MRNYPPDTPPVKYTRPPTNQHVDHRQHYQLVLSLSTIPHTLLIPFFTISIAARITF
jgi:hypothetical protein